MDQTAPAFPGSRGLSDWPFVGATHYYVAMAIDLTAALAFLALGHPPICRPSHRGWWRRSPGFPVLWLARVRRAYGGCTAWPPLRREEWSSESPCAADCARGHAILRCRHRFNRNMAIASLVVSGRGGSAFCLRTVCRLQPLCPLPPLGPPSPLRCQSRLVLAPTGPTASSPSSATEHELRRQHNDLGRCLRHTSASPREEKSSCSRRRVDPAAGTRTSS